MNTIKKLVVCISCLVLQILKSWGSLGRLVQTSDSLVQGIQSHHETACTQVADTQSCRFEGGHFAFTINT